MHLPTTGECPHVQQLLTWQPIYTVLQGDGITLKQLTFTKGEKLYCFEMMTLTELTATIQTEDPWTPGTADNHTPNTASDHTHQQQSENSVNIDAFGSQPFVSDAGSDQGIISILCMGGLWYILLLYQLPVRWRWVELMQWVELVQL